MDFKELLVLLRFGTFPFEEKAICGVTSDSDVRSGLPFHSFRRRSVSNNSTKRRQNGFKIVTRDKFATQLR